MERKFTTFGLDSGFLVLLLGFPDLAGNSLDIFFRKRFSMRYLNDVYLFSFWGVHFFMIFDFDRSFIRRSTDRAYCVPT